MKSGIDELRTGVVERVYRWLVDKHGDKMTVSHGRDYVSFELHPQLIETVIKFQIESSVVEDNPAAANGRITDMYRSYIDGRIPDFGFESMVESTLIELFSDLPDEQLALAERNELIVH